MFAYDLCLEVGEIHPDILLKKLTWQQWEGWLQYREQRGAIGEHRHDIRSEAMQQRMTARIFGNDTSEPPSPVWPYWNDFNAGDLIEAAINTETNLVPKEGGGYEWRQPLER